jgi:hypothetical protein
MGSGSLWEHLYEPSGFTLIPVQTPTHVRLSKCETATVPACGWQVMQHRVVSFAETAVFQASGIGMTLTIDDVKMRLGDGSDALAAKSRR